MHRSPILNLQPDHGKSSKEHLKMDFLLSVRDMTLKKTRVQVEICTFGSHWLWR